MNIILIAAIGRNRELGLDNELLWQLPGDLPRFKALTMGCPIIMGRKTFDSIGRALPGRTNIVVSRNSQWNAQNVVTVSNVHDALEIAEQGNSEQDKSEQDSSEQDSSEQDSSEKVFIIGGGEIYSLFLPYANKLELTIVDDAPKADAFFPDYADFNFIETAREKNVHDDVSFDYVSLDKA